MGPAVTPQGTGGTESLLLDRLRTVVGPAHVLTDPEVTDGFVRDWTGRYVGRTPAVVRPAEIGRAHV